MVVVLAHQEARPRNRSLGCTCDGPVGESLHRDLHSSPRAGRPFRSAVLGAISANPLRHAHLTQSQRSIILSNNNALDVAREIARRIVHSGAGRVRRIFLIGSRATGCARQDSDFDVIIVVEADPDARWGFPDAAKEESRIFRAIQPLGVVVDISVRTADQFVAARSVVGGIEWLAETEGIELYRENFHRRPRALVSNRNVRLALVRSWMDDALRCVEHAAALSSAAPDDQVRVTKSRDPAHYATKSMRSCINAVLVLHQVASFKHESMETVFEKLSAVEPILSLQLRALIAEPRPAEIVARNVFSAVLTKLELQTDLRRCLSGMSAKSRRPAVAIGGNLIRLG
jgi:predicted nucleotidyltransferase